ncbi:unnamed protein product [Ceratitis capitata]|uniref:(Mediterranean fruit fly) hypothetical protein n=1 Tax=Ceratitis capitata TaxID=7213 RepID=A0A811UPJ5_CERCA|nr:unnamed protein product [Ceratitis capitata]
MDATAPATCRNNKRHGDLSGWHNWRHSLTNSLTCTPFLCLPQLHATLKRSTILLLMAMLCTIVATFVFSIIVLEFACDCKIDCNGNNIHNAAVTTPANIVTLDSVLCCYWQ